jgi:hypothetical protein
MAGIITFRATGDKHARRPDGFDAKVAAPARVSAVEPQSRIVYVDNDPIR